jgi:hypothetical protein
MTPQNPQHPARGVIINPAIALGGQRVYCIESANPGLADGGRQPREPIATHG